jgi:hypothetical protein
MAKKNIIKEAADDMIVIVKESADAMVKKKKVE